MAEPPREYLQRMRQLALQVRARERLTTARVTERDLRLILKGEGVEVCRWKHFRRLKGAYIRDDLGATIVINGNLPLAPRVFTLAHELKHHLVDAATGSLLCDGVRRDLLVERGAEEFAAELLFPEALFREEMRRRGIAEGACSAEDLVRLKGDTRTTMSYQALAILACRTGHAADGTMGRIRWMDLQAAILGHRRAT